MARTNRLNFLLILQSFMSLLLEEEILLYSEFVDLIKVFGTLFLLRIDLLLLGFYN